MPAVTELSDIIRSYALRFNTPKIGIAELCIYLQKYSRRYLQNDPCLSMYLEINEEQLIKKLEELEQNGKIEISNDKNKGPVLFIPYYFIDRIAREYEMIKEKPEKPFPLVTAVPSGFSKRFLRSTRINIDFTELDGNVENNSFLYQLIFPDDTPALIFPGNFSTDRMLELAMAKVRLFLQKDELRDFIQKKLLVANPGKEFTVRKFITSIQSYSSDAINTLKISGDIYLFWSYLCSAIKQEFFKKTEKMLDEIATLQSVYIVEYMNNYYRNKTQKNLQRDTALKNLDLAFQKRPFYFDKAAIVNFKDSRGVPLLGQYSEEDLDKYMKDKTVATDANGLPSLLSFKDGDGNRYYVMLEKVVPLIVSLVNSNRKKVRDACLKMWYHQMLKFKSTEAMHNDDAFDELLKNHCREICPVLAFLLEASFISALVSDPHITHEQLSEMQRVFANNKLLSYKDLFLLSREELNSDAKILLPFWYTIPIISTIITFFFKDRPKNTVQKKEPERKEAPKKKPVAKPKKTAREIASELHNALVPEGKNVQTCLIEQLDAWNTNLDPVIRDHNTEDVNAFIKDYIRNVQKSYGNNFTPERVRTVAKTIAKSKSLDKVNNKAALERYVQYYILKLVMHIK